MGVAHFSCALFSQNAQQQAQANNQAFDWQTCQKKCIDGN